MTHAHEGRLEKLLWTLELPMVDHLLIGQLIALLLGGGFTISHFLAHTLLLAYPASLFAALLPVLLRSQWKKKLPFSSLTMPPGNMAPGAWSPAKPASFLPS